MYSKLSWFFGPEFRSGLGRITLYVAILSFLVHLLLFALSPWIPSITGGSLFLHPINAIYTPFSVLLVYEAYLLVYYLRRSTSNYIAKQYEIIALLLIRGIFKDLTHLDLQMGTFNGAGNLELVWDLACVIVVYALIYLFYRISGHNNTHPDEPMVGTSALPIRRFIQAKYLLSYVLLAVLVGLAFTSFWDWWTTSPGLTGAVIDLNSVFFDQFYTILIMSDVLILLLSLLYSDDFPTIIRNSSFVISTILLKLSFAAAPGLSQLFITCGVAFGVLMLYVTNAYYRLELDQKAS